MQRWKTYEVDLWGKAYVFHLVRMPMGSTVVALFHRFEWLKKTKQYSGSTARAGVAARGDYLTARVAAIVSRSKRSKLAK